MRARPKRNRSVPEGEPQPALGNAEQTKAEKRVKPEIGEFVWKAAAGLILAGYTDGAGEASADQSTTYTSIVTKHSG
eukprot:12094295-Karenia_brevis.AAC.1